jgi:N-hydroxyarylamine O-acetyltransferase
VPLDLARYFERIRFRGEARAELATLRALHLAHALAIPFENLDIQLGRPVRLDVETVFAKLVGARRGGYCFEQNTLFAAVLEQIGFKLTRLCGRVRMGRPADAPPPPRTHMVLRVELDEGPYLADVGFGGDELLYPIPLQAGGEQAQESWCYALAREGHTWVLRSRQPEGWIDLYTFSEEPQFAIDYEVANHFTSTHPASRFVQTLTVQRVTPEVRYLLRNRDYEEVRANGRVRRELASAEELLEVLDRTFGLRFPPGTRFRNPAFSPATTPAPDPSTP